MPRNSFFGKIFFFFLVKVLVNFNFRVSWNCLFCSKMGVRALFNFMRKLLPETSFKECDIKSNYYLDLHRKFELSSLISSTVIPVLCSRQRPPWTSPPQVFTSVHLLKKFVGSRFTISSPRFQNNWVKIHRRKKWDRSRFTKVKFLLWSRFTSLPKKWPHI